MNKDTEDILKTLVGLAIAVATFVLVMLSVVLVSRVHTNQTMDRIDRSMDRMMDRHYREANELIDKINRSF